MAPRRTAKPPPVLPPYARGFNFAPPLSLEKWDTMQSKRVRVQILYTVGDEKDQTNHERTFLRTKRVIQDRYPDCFIEGVVLTNQDDAFKILVDAKGVYSKPREREGVYLSTKVLDREIARAKERHVRPTTTVYGGADDLENFEQWRGPRRTCHRRESPATGLVASVCESRYIYNKRLTWRGATAARASSRSRR